MLALYESIDGPLRGALTERKQGAPSLWCPVSITIFKQAPYSKYFVSTERFLVASPMDQVKNALRSFSLNNEDYYLKKKNYRDFWTNGQWGMACSLLSDARGNPAHLNCVNVSVSQQVWIPNLVLIQILALCDWKNKEYGSLRCLEDADNMVSVLWKNYNW